MHIFSHSPSSAASTSATADRDDSSFAQPSSAPLLTIRLPASSASALAAARKQVSLSASLAAARHNDRHNQSADNRPKRKNKTTALHASTVVDELTEGGGELLLAVRFAGDGELVVARGDRERVLFERVRYGGGGAGEEVVLEARTDESAEAQREEGLPRKRVRLTAYTHLLARPYAMRKESERERFASCGL